MPEQVLLTVFQTISQDVNMKKYRHISPSGESCSFPHFTADRFFQLLADKVIPALLKDQHAKTKKSHKADHFTPSKTAVVS